jgi:hypothetical protein
MPIITLVCGLSLRATGSEPAQSRPRLAVLVVFDQMRADYLTRWEKLFQDGGFRRLQKAGAWFQNCNYPYAVTVTAAGHASIVTGCSPDTHGIVGNEWYDPAEGREVSCIGSDRYERVPPLETKRSSGKLKKKNLDGNGGASPERLLVPTIGDVLKDSTGGKARVVSMSFKDRSAILPAGRHPDACYWLGPEGAAVTSTYYRDHLHPWAEAFNEMHVTDRWLGKQWRRLLPELDYALYSGPDDVAGEGTGAHQGRTFPHPFGGATSTPDSVYYQALYNSPFGNDLLLEFAKRAIDGEQLGTREVPDLLCISFSSNDLVGHCYGPDSQEVLDITLRSDLIVRDLLNFLDAKVGKGRYVLALTADHGVCPLPEVARKQGKDAGRVTPLLWRSQAEAHLKKTFGAPANGERWIEALSPPWIYLNHATLKAHGVQAEDAEVALGNWLKKQTGIDRVYTRIELARGLPESDQVGAAVRRSFYAPRCGDVTGITKPYYIVWSSMTGTTHGTPYDYDTHVPLLVFGPGITAGVRHEAVTPQAIAAIFAQSLGIPAPAKAEAPGPSSLHTPSSGPRAGGTP